MHSAHHPKNLMNQDIRTHLADRKPAEILQEHHDLYRHVCLSWNNDDGTATRIIECKNRIQWIVQHHKGGRWRSKSFCRTRQCLQRLLWSKASEIREALPPSFVEQ